MEVTDDDLIKGAELRRMKVVALGLLVAAAVLFLVATLVGARGIWGYVQAFAEAAMVGALADWFAVTALFRHPLRIPIPHTAIIPRRKDQIGASLGEFVEGNFLTEEVIGERIVQADIAQRAGDWLRHPDNAQRVSAIAADGLKGALEVLDDDEVQTGLERIVRTRLEDIDVAALAARAIDLTVEGGHFQRLLDAVIVAVDNFLGDSKETFRAKLYAESPWWVPESIDNKVLDKIYDVVGRFLTEVRADPTHDIRHTIEARLIEFSNRLKTDPELIAKGDAFKHEILDHPAVRAWIDSLWASTKNGLIEMTDDPTSELRFRMARSCQRFGDRLATEADVRAKLDTWISRGVGYVVINYRSEVSNLISSTVQRWDGEQTARKMELQVGRDLQFIRINGTLVGGLAGLAIHAIAELL